MYIFIDIHVYYDIFSSPLSPNLLDIYIWFLVMNFQAEKLSGIHVE